MRLFLLLLFPHTPPLHPSLILLRSPAYHKTRTLTPSSPSPSSSLGHARNSLSPSSLLPPFFPGCVSRGKRGGGGGGGGERKRGGGVEGGRKRAGGGGRPKRREFPALFLYERRTKRKPSVGKRGGGLIFLLPLPLLSLLFQVFN